MKTEKLKKTYHRDQRKKLIKYVDHIIYEINLSLLEINANAGV